MDIVVNEDLKAYIDPLTPEEYDALERSILTEGCRDALVLWGDLLVDGHNRYGICKKHGLPFSTVQAKQFQTLEDVHLWMIDQHLGRRSISDFQRGVLALRKRDILEARLKAAQAQREAQAMAAPGAGAPAAAADESAPEGAPWETASEAGADAASPATPATEPTPVDTRLLTSREALAKAARISSSQVKLIEAIQNQAAPEVVAAVKSGDLSLAAAAAVATLPAEEQVQAAQAGVKELKQAAKRVREANKKPKAEPAPDESDADAASAEAAPAENVETLRARIRELEAENATLRAQLAQLQGQAAP